MGWAAPPTLKTEWKWEGTRSRRVVPCSNLIKAYAKKWEIQVFNLLQIKASKFLGSQKSLVVNSTIFWETTFSEKLIYIFLQISLTISNKKCVRKLHNFHHCILRAGDSQWSISLTLNPLIFRCTQISAAAVFCA